MKKILILVLAAVLFAGMIFMPAAAAENGTAAFANINATPGSVAKLTLSLDHFGMANTIGVTFTTPEGLTLLKEQSAWLPGGEISDISTNQAAWAANDAIDVDNRVLTLAFAVPANAAIGTEYTVTCTVQVKNNQEVLGQVTASGRITVSDKKLTLTVTPETVTIDLASARTAELKAAVEPSEAGKTVVWSSSNAAVAAVANGVVTAKGIGTAVITATVDDVSDTCQVTVTCSHVFTGDAAACNICGHPREELPASVPMFRMYDPNSSEHFYTGSEKERDGLIALGWQYEGVGFNFPIVGPPVHRLYDPVTGEHLYTMDDAEKQKLLDAGWNYENVAFNSAGTNEVPQYRLWNPNAIRGAYHFTGSTDERDWLMSLGWQYQGIGWYSCLR